MAISENLNQILQEPDFRRLLKSRQFGDSAFFLLFGEEDYVKKADLALARQAVCPDNNTAFFNFIQIDGSDFSPERLTEAAMPIPMGTDFKLITVTGLDIASMKKEEFDGFISATAAARDFDYNIIIISIPDGCLDYGILPSQGKRGAPSKALSSLQEYYTPVYFSRNTPSQLAAWVQKHFGSKKVIASPDVCRELINYCGTDMFRLASETDKLSYLVLAAGRNTVTVDDIRNGAIRGIEYGAFDFSNAIINNNRNEALSILADMKFKKIEPTAVFSEVARTFCDSLTVKILTEKGTPQADIASILKCSPARVSVYQRQIAKIPRQKLEAAVRACADADMDIKTSGKGFAPLEQLICLI